MLELRNIKKTYFSKSGDVEALHGISLTFRNSEFVSILGPSGCGKTTLLNIIGGLDKYTSGDFLINNISTKDYTEADWNTFRNHSVGFIFQSYNLIPHQTVLSNVEMALTLSGISKEERVEKAKLALERVGLKDQIYKKPNQLSGGQAQRVAIARAIVNNPDIILADEPTGALDYETSIQVMDILKELSKDTLVVMVTHNPDLAEKYSDRIIKLFDGNITDDSKPYSETSEAKEDTKNKRHSSMSIFTAFYLSLMNLLSKKSRTILTVIAGSIGIIGVSLVLALSTGFQGYIDKVQKDSLSSYPLQIIESSYDIDSLLTSFMNYTPAELEKYPEVKKVFVNKIQELLLSSKSENTLTEEYVNNVVKKIPQEYIEAISYQYPLLLNIYNDYIPEGKEEAEKAYRISDTNSSLFNQLIDNKDFVLEQYDIIYGNYPEKYNEVVLVVNEYNQITDYVLNGLFLDDKAFYLDDKNNTVIDFESILKTTFKFIPNDALLSKVNDAYLSNEKKETTMSGSKTYVSMDVYNNEICEEIKIVGILRLNPNTQTGLMGQLSAIGYLPSLIEHIYDVNKNSDYVKYLTDNKDVLIQTIGELTYNKSLRLYGGSLIPNAINIYPTSFAYKNKVKEYLDSYNNNSYDNKMREYYIQKGTEYCETNQIVVDGTDSEKESKYYDYGIKNPGTKKELDEAMVEANSTKVKYTDIMSVIISSVSTIVDAITYVLIAFTSISLIVSSIMIGVITYISVIERTKEIGILRALGARRKDVFRIFTAETFLIGLSSGIFGCSVTALLCIPINAILKELTGISNIAGLQFGHALIIIAISFILTVVSGLIPSGKATKIDPVVALRTE